MSFVLPKPKIVTRDGEPDEVILSYADWREIVAQLREAGGDDSDEDAEDVAAVAAARAADTEFAARVAAERGSPVEVTVPLQVVKAKLDGAHPLKAWREYRGITQTELASRSGVARDLIAQIETHKKQGSVTTLDRLARALSIRSKRLSPSRGDTSSSCFMRVGRLLVHHQGRRHGAQRAHTRGTPARRDQS
jgi:DNA-binding XRE family transcriptional regulator